jgi:O-acetyl-ADP-ribose deacetylase (regulator of RNase III)
MDLQVEIREGDIISASETYLCHQCNCVSHSAKGLAKDIFKAFPYSNVYKYREEYSKPGTIEIRGDSSKGERKVVALYAQYSPGITEFKGSSRVTRENWFWECLYSLEKILEKEDSLAFPYKIGCGLAGGNWNEYLSAINDLARRTGNKIVIYKLKGSN